MKKEIIVLIIFLVGIIIGLIIGMNITPNSKMTNRKTRYSFNISADYRAAYIIRCDSETGSVEYSAVNPGGILIKWTKISD